MNRSVAAVLSIAALAIAIPASSQQPAPTIKRTPLQKLDVPNSTTMEVITGTAEILPGVNIGRHTHPGAETGYVLTGEMTLMVDGKPPVVLKVGDSYQVPAGAVHDAKGGEAGLKVLAVYVVEKGKPLATPAP